MDIADLNSKKRVLIFYAKAGGGHESAAKAFRSEMLEQDPSINVKLVDIAGKNESANYLANKGYILLTEHLTWLWAFFTYLWKQRWFMWFTYQYVKLASGKWIKENLEEFQPELVISTYFFSSDYVNHLIENKKLHLTNADQIKVYTTVTEIFSAPTIWFYNKSTKYLVFSNYAKEIAQKCRVPDSNILEFGTFFNKKFNEKPTSSQLDIVKNEYRKTSNPLILLVGGGSSIPKGDKILLQLLKIKQPIEIIMVCGRNEKLKDYATQLTQKYNQNNHSVTVLGFTDKLHELINLSDLIITKGGPAMILEILSQEKPMLVSHYIWEQEKGNMEYVVKNNCGYYEPNIERLGVLINKTVNNLDQWQELKTNVIQVKPKSHIGDIVKFLLT
jgi:UDP-N-acetylglucosamine:LPS N-acetylglucosamine transferase